MDASGKVLGYANSNSYSYDDGSGKTVTNTSVNYDSADREPLGGTQTDAHSIRSSIIEVIDNSDNSNDVDLTPADTGNAKEITFKGSIRVETETETLFKADGVTPEDAPARTRTHYFKADDFHTEGPQKSHLGGIEVDGANTQLFGAEYARGASTTDVSKLTLTTADTSKLPSEFVSYVLDPSGAAGPQTVNVTVKVAGDPAKFVFTKGTTTDAWDPMVDGINEEDTYIFDTSDVSMKGYTLGFSDVKDNGTGGTPLAAADGVTVADAAPGTTGAKTTLVLPAGYGGGSGSER